MIKWLNFVQKIIVVSFSNTVLSSILHMYFCCRVYSCRRWNDSNNNRGVYWRSHCLLSTQLNFATTKPAY